MKTQLSIAYLQMQIERLTVIINKYQAIIDEKEARLKKDIANNKRKEGRVPLNYPDTWMFTSFRC